VPFTARDVPATVSAVCKIHNIPASKVDDVNSAEFIDWLKELKPDVILSLSANQVFGTELLRVPGRGVINIHGSDLPRRRGLMPSFWTLYDGENRGAVTAFFVDEGIDTGPILLKVRFPVPHNRSLDKLIRISKSAAARAAIRAIELVASGEFQLSENPDVNMTYCRFPTRKDVQEFFKRGNKLF